MIGHEVSAEHAAVIEEMKSQLLIVLVNRLGGDIDIPASEIDATGQYMLAMSVDPETRSFHFEVRKKS